MREDVKALSSRIDDAKVLCKRVLEAGEKIKKLSPDEMGMEAYSEEVEQFTESRGRATRTAIKELTLIGGLFSEIENDSTASEMEKAFLNEKISAIQALSPLFAQQSVAIRKIIEKHLTAMRQESVEFNQKVGVIKTYLKTPDKRTFYG
jgi:hypothetical protein